MSRYEPQPDQPGMAYCYDPTHDDECDCGADPDREYERVVEERR